MKMKKSFNWFPEKDFFKETCQMKIATLADFIIVYAWLCQSHVMENNIMYMLNCDG